MMCYHHLEAMVGRSWPVHQMTLFARSDTVTELVDELRTSNDHCEREVKKHTLVVVRRPWGWLQGLRRHRRVERRWERRGERRGGRRGGRRASVP